MDFTWHLICCPSSGAAGGWEVKKMVWTKCEAPETAKKYTKRNTTKSWKSWMEAVEIQPPQFRCDSFLEVGHLVYRSLWTFQGLFPLQTPVVKSEIRQFSTALEAFRHGREGLSFGMVGCWMLDVWRLRHLVIFFWKTNRCLFVVNYIICINLPKEIFININSPLQFPLQNGWGHNPTRSIGRGINIIYKSKCVSNLSNNSTAQQHIFGVCHFLVHEEKNSSKDGTGIHSRHIVLAISQGKYLANLVFFRPLYPNVGSFKLGVTERFRYLKWRNPHQYKLYGYGLCKGNRTPKIAVNKVLSYLYFREVEGF